MQICPEVDYSNAVEMFAIDEKLMWKIGVGINQKSLIVQYNSVYYWGEHEQAPH